MAAVASMVARSDVDVAEALVVAAVGADDADGDGGGPASLSPHAETAANISVPVAQEINPSRNFMALCPAASRCSARGTDDTRGGAGIV